MSYDQVLFGKTHDDQETNPRMYFYNFIIYMDSTSNRENYQRLRNMKDNWYYAGFEKGSWGTEYKGGIERSGSPIIYQKHTIYIRKWISLHFLPIITDKEVTVMISSVYSYYLAQYGHKTNSKYDTHTKAQLKNTYGRVLKSNSQTPTYKADMSEAAQKYAIDLKENARELSNIANELSGSDGHGMVFKKSAVSDNPDAVTATFIGDSSSADDTSLDIEVRQLATSQINTGHYLQPNSRTVKPGDYSFDLNINNLTYEFQFNVDEEESNSDIQNKLARLINRSNIGLNASVSEDSLGNTALNIESDMTGVSVIKPTIFNIRPNNDIQTDNPDFVEGFDEPTMEKNTNFIETYGLDRVTQYPSNAIFSVNGEERSSASNDITINKTFAISFHNTTDKPATISLKDDADSITESITELVSGYNRLVSIAADKENDKFEGNAKLKKEFSRIMKAYQPQLERNGLTVSDEGSLEVNKVVIQKAASDGTLSDVFNALDSFKKSIQRKADDISINPMNYVNNKIVAYKNPYKPVNDPYNLSAYSGMMFNGYI